MGRQATAVATRITSLRLQRVLHDFGALLAVTAIDDESFRVATPFSFANGDMFPIVIETRGTGWRLTDRGDTVATLTGGQVELAQRHLDLIKAIAEASGFTLSGSHHISADFDDLPSPQDIANLIALQARISALPHDIAPMPLAITRART